MLTRFSQGNFIEIAGQIPYDHPAQDALVSLVEALQNLPPTKAIIWSETEIWTQLPMLGPSMAEAWIRRFL